MLYTVSMKILSLFDGISCARVALERAGIPVEAYYASEIDKYAIQIGKKNWEHKNPLSHYLHIGDVKDVSHKKFIMEWDYPKYSIDLLIGGSPCQNLSAAGNGLGLDGEESKLFYEYIRILKETNPTYFILENVASMKPEQRDKISEVIGVQPIMINANLVSAQDRKRYFWTNIPNITQPADKGIFLRNIITTEGKDITDRMNKKVVGTLAHKKTWGNVRNLNQKSKTLTKAGQGIANTGATNIKLDDGTYKIPTEIECERLQGLPDNYTEGVSSTQRYAVLGNAFNVDVVAHILSFIPR